MKWVTLDFVESLVVESVDKIKRQHFSRHCSKSAFCSRQRWTYERRQALNKMWEQTGKEKFKIIRTKWIVRAHKDASCTTESHRHERMPWVVGRISSMTEMAKEPCSSKQNRTERLIFIQCSKYTALQNRSWETCSGLYSVHSCKCNAKFLKKSLTETIPSQVLIVSHICIPSSMFRQRVRSGILTLGVYFLTPRFHNRVLLWALCLGNFNLPLARFPQLSVLCLV